MRTLKRIIYVYEEKIVIKGHHFKYEMRKATKKNSENTLYTSYTLYDSEASDLLIEVMIPTYEGMKEIAEAYLTGDKQALEEAKRIWC